jgi:hypothetical protein
MRINVYGEELTDEVEHVTKKVYDDKFGDRTFHGVRLFLKSPDELHDDPEDDDRSAITLWVKEGDQDGIDTLDSVLHRLARLATEIQPF